MSLPYDVPGETVVLTQPSPKSCWATVYTMMRSWKDQSSYDLEAAVAAIGDKYLEILRADTALPVEEFGPFLDAAGMTH